MLCETPVVTTKGTDIWRELEQSEGALIVERSPQAFASAISSLVEDKEARKVAGISGRKHMLSWLDTDTVARRYEAMYEDAAKARGI
jgi:glycosyltransferase involved in cell wall biosynthesis